MRNIIFVLFAVVAAMLTTSCNKNETASVQTLVPVIATTSFTDGIIITEGNTSQSFNFYWTKAMFEDRGAVKYTIQIDSGNGTFKNPVSLLETTELKGVATLGDLNTKLNAYGVNACEWKNIKFRVLASSGASTFSSVAKEFALTLFSVNQKHPVLTSSNSSALIITKDNSGSAIDFSWTAASFGVNGAISYALQVDTSAKFTNPIVLESNITGISKSINIGSLNKQLLGKGFAPNVKYTFKFRIVASSVAASFTLNSGALQNDITPMKGDMYIYTKNGGYDPAGASLLNSSLDGLQYDHFMYLGNWEEYRLLPSNTSKDGEIGGYPDGSRNFAGHGDLSTASNHWGLWCPETYGIYYLKFDLTAMNYTSYRVDYFSIAGNAVNGGNDWSGRVKMNYNSTTSILSVTANLKVGQFKIIGIQETNGAADEGSWNYSLVYGDATHVKPGTGSAGNLSIAEDGNYMISINMKSYPYTYSLTKN